MYHSFVVTAHSACDLAAAIEGWDGFKHLAGFYMALRLKNSEQ
jgi:hypothetical protein